jgi:UDP-3-O-[3-hydroxymyristoyl] glucosamine N-acyltransferase
MPKEFTLEELATLTQSLFVGNPKHRVSYVNNLESASHHEVSFLANPRYKELLSVTNAGIICIDTQTPLIEGKNFLVSDNPSKSFQLITDKMLAGSASGFKGIHPMAVLHETVHYADDVVIGPNTTIDQGVTIGKGCKIIQMSLLELMSL